jgi:hypothetical protein
VQGVLDREAVQAEDLRNPGHLGLVGLVQADGHELAGLSGLNRLADPLQVVRLGVDMEPAAVAVHRAVRDHVSTALFVEGLPAAATAAWTVGYARMTTR